jgi:predicted transcriptional regulator
MTDKTTKEKLDDIARRMKTAKTDKQKEALQKELDAAIGYDSGDDRYDPERDAQWVIKNRGR